MDQNVLDIIVQLSMITTLISIFLVSIRLLAGPDPADRIVAMDLITYLIVSFIVIVSIYSEIDAFLDVAIAYALIAFLGTVALARFRERLARGSGRRKPDGDRS